MFPIEFRLKCLIEWKPGICEEVDWVREQITSGHKTESLTKGVCLSAFESFDKLVTASCSASALIISVPQAVEIFTPSRTYVNNASKRPFWYCSDASAAACALVTTCLSVTRCSSDSC